MASIAQETEAQRIQRSLFLNEVLESLMIHPVSSEIAQLAGRIEGEQAALGISIAFEDLVIGATALHLGFDVATHNRRHFELIPTLRVISL